MGGPGGVGTAGFIDDLLTAGHFGVGHAPANGELGGVNGALGRDGGSQGEGSDSERKLHG